jgi:hypothetical protein
MGAFESTASVVHLFARCEVRESCSPLSTRLRAPAGVPSLRMCRRRFEPPWAHSQGGHPREARDGEACISHQAGRRDGRRRPKAFEHEDRHTPPQGGEPERRRDQRRTRRQAGATEIRSHVPSDVAAERGPQQRAWRSQAPLKELRPASGRSATGGRLAPRHGPRRPPVTVSPLLVHRGPRESRASLSTRRGAPAGVPSLRMCRRRFEDAWAHSQGGHPREARHGEACISHQAGRRDARRWPKAFEHENRHLPPQGGEPERRRDEHRSRRKADLSSLSRLAPATAGVSGARGTDPRPFVR